MSAAQATSEKLTRWVNLGLRADPEVKRLFKARAALEHRAMEDILHDLLCEYVGRRDLRIDGIVAAN